jgi:RNA-directed DNA polymerase
MKSFEKYSKEFEKKAIDAGFSQVEINQCLEYAKPIILQGLPIVYNTSHFSVLVGYNQNYLRRAVRTDSTDYFYRTFNVKKVNGGVRTIKEPLPSLKEIQKWILVNILNKISISPYSKAYYRKRSIRDHARYHKNQKILVTMDVEKFFDNISFEKILGVFINLGYSTKVSQLLSKLCTLEKMLPQGAPTSPYLSNIIMKNFDREISKHCLSNDIKYTRYADDMAFSSNEIDILNLTFKVEEELKHIGLKLNKEKTLEMPYGKRQLVSGIVVNEKIQVPRIIRDELRQAMYFIQKHGLENHLEKINCKKANYLNHLMGLANYILFINPKDERTKNIMIKLKEEYKNER